LSAGGGGGGGGTSATMAYGLLVLTCALLTMLMM